MDSELEFGAQTDENTVLYRIFPWPKQGRVCVQKLMVDYPRIEATSQIKTKLSSENLFGGAFQVITNRVAACRKLLFPSDHI